MFEVAGDAAFVLDLESVAAGSASGLDTERRFAGIERVLRRRQERVERGRDRGSGHACRVVLDKYRIRDRLLAAMLRNWDAVITEVKGDIEDGERRQVRKWRK